MRLAQRPTPWLGHGQRAEAAELVSGLERTGSKKQLSVVSKERQLHTEYAVVLGWVLVLVFYMNFYSIVFHGERLNDTLDMFDILNINFSA